MAFLILPKTKNLDFRLRGNDSRWQVPYQKPSESAIYVSSKPQRRIKMDILSRLQALPPGRFHYKLLVLVGIGWLFDAMDTGIVSFILPELAKKGVCSRRQLGWRSASPLSAWHWGR